MKLKFEPGDKVRYVANFDLNEFDKNAIYTVKTVFTNPADDDEIKVKELPYVGGRYSWKFELVEREGKYKNFLDRLATIDV